MSERDVLRVKTYRVELSDREEEELRVLGIRMGLRPSELFGDVLRRWLHQQIGDPNPGHSKKVREAA